MLRHNSKTKYEPNSSHYLQMLLGEDLYNQMIVVSSEDTFSARFPNIFVNYPLGEM